MYKIFRFNKYIEFHDYTKEELYQIFEYICASASYTIDAAGEEALKEYIEKIVDDKDEKFGNARTIRNIFERSIAFQANRVMNMEEMPEELSLIVKADIIRCL